jgi:alginate O-acetyltransferase complex protein AlgJ
VTPRRRARFALAAALAAACGAGRPAAAERAAAALARLAAEAEAEGRSVVPGKDGWLFVAAELRHLGLGRFWGADAARASRAPKPEWKDPLPAILDFRDQLRRAGVELLLVPVPPKAAAVPDTLPDGAAAGSAGRLDAADAEFYGVLRAAGIELLDLQPELAAQREPRAFCRTDTHWSGAGIAAAAARIAERAKRGAWYAAVPKRRFAAQERDVEITGDLARMPGGAGAPRETLRLRFVSQEGDASGAPVAPSRESPVLLLGDSHTLVFHAGGDMHARGAGLADQLALELGFPVDLVGVRGSGATPARINLARRKDGLAGKKLVVWCFGARELSEAGQGWAKVPVVR